MDIHSLSRPLAATLMCDVACGRLDSYYEWGVHAWDIAAASIIIEEAGGVCISPTATSSVTDPLDLVARYSLNSASNICSWPTPDLFPFLLAKGRCCAVRRRSWRPCSLFSTRAGAPTGSEHRTNQRRSNVQRMSCCCFLLWVLSETTPQKLREIGHFR